MRPALVALLAAVLPLGVYAHQGWSSPPAAKVVSQKAEPAAAPIVIADNAVEKKSGDVATTTTPDVPSKDPPLCASPAISVWNPAATGDGRVCQPTQWAEAKAGRG